MDPLVKLATAEAQTSGTTPCEMLCTYTKQDSDQVRSIMESCESCVDQKKAFKEQQQSSSNIVSQIKCETLTL